MTLLRRRVLCGSATARRLSMAPDDDLAAEIQALLSEKLLVEVDSPDADLLETGSLDSLTLVQLLLHLEEHFDVRLALDELEIQDFRSIRSIARLVRAQRPAPAGQDRADQPQRGTGAWPIRVQPVSGRAAG